jgi:hypothetical protein
MNNLAGSFKEGRYKFLSKLSEDQAQYLVENNDIVIRLINQKFAAAIKNIKKKVLSSVNDHINDRINDSVKQALEDRDAREYRDHIETLKSMSRNPKLQHMVPIERLRYVCSNTLLTCP